MVRQNHRESESPKRKSTPTNQLNETGKYKGFEITHSIEWRTEIYQRRVSQNFIKGRSKTIFLVFWTQQTLNWELKQKSKN